MHTTRTGAPTQVSCSGPAARRRAAPKMAASRSVESFITVLILYTATVKFARKLRTISSPRSLRLCVFVWRSELPPSVPVHPRSPDRATREAITGLTAKNAEITKKCPSLLRSLRSLCSLRLILCGLCSRSLPARPALDTLDTLHASAAALPRCGETRKIEPKREQNGFFITDSTDFTNGQPPVC